MSQAKKKRQRKTSAKATPAPGQATADRGTSSSAHNVRETIESLVIAFVLAFLFRSFEAEAFVIPTGSMAPTLQGRHKDVHCPQCGYRYRASASSEADDRVLAMGARAKAIEAKRKQLEKDLERGSEGAAPNQLLHEVERLKNEEYHLTSRVRSQDVVSSMCPMCRYVREVDQEKSFNGDRILVNKFTYQFTDPQRWDVGVFKFPGDAKVNYIKRFVGLPGEIVKIKGGDIYIAPLGTSDFQIARKPPDKVIATMQMVHDNRYQPSRLIESGWPYRWRVWEPAGEGGWQVAESRVGDQNRTRVFSTDGTNTQASWIRYQHLVPGRELWDRIEQGLVDSDDISEARPQLIADFYAYNTYLTRETHGMTADKLGMHWVGDLMVQLEAKVDKAEGELLVDLVEGGRHFGCQIDLKSGEASLSISGADGFSPKAKTAMKAAGTYTVAFANVDDQLLLWIDGSLVSFDGPTTYDRSVAFGSEEAVVPQSTVEDVGDLAPLGVGTRGAAVTVSALRVFRDVYYIADDRGVPGGPITDYVLSGPRYSSLSTSFAQEILSDPSRWDLFAKRQSVEFSLDKDQFFVLGDNSPFSKDGRLWDEDGFGHYVDRRMLIGKALYIYWPHSQDRIPGTQIPFPKFPNFPDMGLVR